MSRGGLNSGWRASMMTSTASKVIWITGASSGLGKSMALQYARQGHRVIASARNRVALGELAILDDNILPLVCDITDAKAMESLAERMTEFASALDLVILNAGTCEYLDFPEPDWSAVRRVMEVNFFGTVNCVQVALPLLRLSRKQAHLVAIASQVTAAPFPRAEAYGASKAAIHYFFDSLRLDLSADDIDVTVVNPGFVDTPLTRRNDFSMPFLMPVDEAAERIIKNLKNRPRRYGFPLRLSALLWISNLLPGLWQKMLTPKTEITGIKSDQGAKH